jgi:hypothetical protein
LSAAIHCGVSQKAFGQEPELPDVGAQFRAKKAPRVNAEVVAVPLRHRNGAVFQIDWSLKWTGKQLVEGHLDYTVNDQMHPVARFEGEKIVLDEQVRRYSNMLPALEASNSWAELTIHARFVTAKQAYDLGEFPLRLQQRTERTFVIAAADAWGVGGASGASDWERTLRLERFYPGDPERMMATVVSRVTASEFSVDPLSYCVFDVVLLADEAFARMRERQLAAITKWVEAGGSVLVAPAGSLGRIHLDFLNEIAGQTGDQPPFLADETGNVLGIPASGRPKIVLARKGLGRAAVLLEAAPRGTAANEEEWRKMVWFLWKGRSDVLPAIVNQGQWPADAVAKGEYLNPERWSTGYQTTPTLAVTKLRSGGWLLDQLVPKRVQMMPMSVMGMLLLLYVVAVGPADYLLLGLLRLRKYTWVVFPVVTLGFASFTLWLSERYMATDDQRRAAVFLDILDDGRIARENRVELLLMSSHGQVERNVTGALFTPLEGTFGESSSYHSFYRNNVAQTGDYSVDSPAARAPSIRGRIPERYVVSQSVPKWTPQLNRVTAMASPDYAVDFDWGSITAAALADGGPRAAIMQRIRKAFGSDATVYSLQGRTMTLLGGRALHMQPPTGVDTSYWASNYAAVEPHGQSSSYLGFLHEACVRPERGLFTLVSQISPTGGDNFEDLPILDPSDGSRGLLLVCVPRGNDLLFYRKLYALTP